MFFKSVILSKIALVFFFDANTERYQLCIDVWESKRLSGGSKG